MKFLMIVMMIFGSLSVTWGRNDSVDVFFCRGYSFSDESNQSNGISKTYAIGRLSLSEEDSLPYIICVGSKVSMACVPAMINERQTSMQKALYGNGSFVSHTMKRDTTVSRSLNICSQSDVADQKKPWYLAVKTNMLYDALLTPNIGLEYAFARRFSVSTSWMYAWWNNDSRHRYWRIYGGDAELRYWLGRRAAAKPLQGHHLGVYGQMLTYDIELGSKGYLGDKWNYSVGISYGYSLPVTRRLNLDFTVRLGYMGGRYEEYVPIDECYVWQATKNRHYLGPTGAEISLVWLLGHGNVNKRRGGRL